MSVSIWVSVVNCKEVAVVVSKSFLCVEDKVNFVVVTIDSHHVLYNVSYFVISASDVEELGRLSHQEVAVNEAKC